MNEHLKLLGYKVKDVITGLKGVIVSISFDISGCVQGYVKPEHDKNNKEIEGMWIDTKRLKKIKSKPVVILPTFETVPGGQKLPSPPEQIKK